MAPGGAPLSRSGRVGVRASPAEIPYNFIA